MPPPSPTTFSITIAVNSYPRGQPHGQNDTVTTEEATGGTLSLTAQKRISSEDEGTPSKNLPCCSDTDKVGGSCDTIRAGELKSKRRSRFELEDPEELVEGSTPPKTRRLDDWEGASAADASSVGGILSKLVQEIEEMKVQINKISAENTVHAHTRGYLMGHEQRCWTCCRCDPGEVENSQCSENSQIPPWYKLKTQKTKDDKLEAVPAKPTLGSNDPHNSLDHHHWFGRGACGMIVPLQLSVVSLCSEVEIELDRDGVDDAGEEGIGEVAGLPATGRAELNFGLAEQIAGRAHKYSGPDEPFSESGDNDMITGTDGPEVDKLQFSIW
ncbi:hypothetical protein BU15DRAFT_60646 [Melanogaster broomeanus]|nr:hypothetical protein BU15DRAFT_60646 [Melanogaster broomeanus]